MACSFDKYLAILNAKTLTHSKESSTFCQKLKPLKNHQRGEILPTLVTLQSTLIDLFGHRSSNCGSLLITLNTASILQPTGISV